MSEEKSREGQRPRAGRAKTAKTSTTKTSSTTSAPKEPFAAGYDFLLVNRDISNGLLGSIMACVSANKKHDKVVLALVTYGGLPNEAYRVARYLQSVYDEVVAFVPSTCKSAGTLIVTGASRVVMSPFGDLGPLDVQLLQRDEIAGRRSGLTTRSALDDLKTHTFEIFEHFMLQIVNSSSGAISFRLAAEVSARVASEVMSRVYEQVNPDALGQDFRDLSVATKYCERLNKRYRNLKPGATRRLVHEYPSHDFVIDYEEAKELFERLEQPSSTLYNLMIARTSDMISPKTGKAAVVEMLMLDDRLGVKGQTKARPERNRNAQDQSANER